MTVSSVLSPALSFPSSENENSVFTYTRASDLQRLRHSLSTPRSFIANAVKICEDVIRRLLVLYKYSVALQAELSNQGQTQLYKKSPFPSNVDPPAGDPAVERSREVDKVVCHASESHQAGSAPRTAPAERALPLVAL